MSHVNLLPPEEKVNLGYEFRIRAITIVGSSFLAVLAVAFVLLLPTKFLLLFQTEDVLRALDIERKQEAQSGISADIANIKEANRMADLVNRNMESRSRFSASVQNIFGAVPSGVSLSLLTYARGSRRVSVEGFAPTRESLLSFIGALKQRSEIQDVASPVSNVIRDTEVLFSLTLTIR